MKSTEQLKAWAESEKAKGLVDIKFFPGTSNQVSVEEIARNVNEALANETIDITDDEL